MKPVYTVTIPVTVSLPTQAQKEAREAINIALTGHWEVNTSQNGIIAPKKLPGKLMAKLTDAHFRLARSQTFRLTLDVAEDGELINFRVIQ